MEISQVYQINTDNDHLKVINRIQNPRLKSLAMVSLTNLQSAEENYLTTIKACILADEKING